MVILEFDFKSLNDKIVNSYLPQMLKESQNVRGKDFYPVAISFYFRERTSSFSLEIHAIQPLAVFGARRKDVLCGAVYAWVQDL